MKNFYFLLLLSCVINNISVAQTYSKVWSGIYTDTSISNTNINDMVVDKQGNSYIAGYKIFNGGEYYQTHLFLLKINAQGAQEWIRYFNDAKDSIDNVYAAALDASGNIYITGKRVDTFCNICTQSSKISDIITMKYDAAGNRVWLNRYHDSDYHLAAPSDITIAGDGAIIVTGNISIYNSSEGDYENKMILLKLHADGTTAWRKKVDTVVGNSSCFDNEKNIVVAGAYNPDNLYQTQKPMLMKYSADGSLKWKKVFDEYEKNGQYYFVQCDSLNNIYANGQTDTIAFYNNPRILTIKYNSAGIKIWSHKEQNETTTMPHYYGDFKIDNAGNCYVTGTIHKSDIDDDWLITKYNSAGERRWLATDDDAYHGSDKPAALVIDNAGNSCIAGYEFNNYSNYSIATIMYSNSGALLDKKLYTARKNSNGFGEAVGVDGKNNFYTGGSIGFYNSSPEIIAIRYRKSEQPIALNNVENKLADSVNIYPNPAKNNLNIFFNATSNLKNYKCIICNLNGNKIIETSLNNAGKFYSANVDVHVLQTGLYNIKIFDGKNIISKTFLKE